jgi:hypothetical protein
MDSAMTMMQDLFGTEWFLSECSGHLAMNDLRSLLATNRQIRAHINKWIESWPSEVQEVFRKWPRNDSYIVVFGCHHAYPGDRIINGEELIRSDSMINGELILNPSPILKMSMESMAFDAVSELFVGNPWKEIETLNAPPLAIGRMYPNVCKADPEGTKVFYCGGRLAAKRGDIHLSSTDGFEKCVSVVTMMFDLKTSTWKRLQDMPQGRENAGICRVGSKIYLIGGEYFDGGGDEPCPAESVICFDLDQERWVPEEELLIPNKPGNAYSGFAVGRISQTDIIVAGGEHISEYHEEYGPLVGCSSEVFILSLSNKSWTRLPDLPATARDFKNKLFASVLATSSHREDEKFALTVSDGRNFVKLVEDAEAWEVLPSPLEDGLSDNGSVMVQNCQQSILLSNYGGHVYSEQSNVWVRLPGQQPETRASAKWLDIPCVAIRKNREDDNFCVLMTNQYTALAVGF